MKTLFYRNYCIDSNQILQSDKDRQVLFVGGPNSRPTDLLWRKATILNKKLSSLSYRRETTRCVVSVEILLIATQQSRKYWNDKIML